MIKINILVFERLCLVIYFWKLLYVFDFRLVIIISFYFLKVIDFIITTFGHAVALQLVIYVEIFIYLDKILRNRILGRNKRVFICLFISGREP